MTVVVVAALAIAGVVNTWIIGTLFDQARATLAPLQQKNGWRWLPLRWFAKGALCHFCVAHWVGIAFGVAYYLRPAETWIAMLTIAAVYVSVPLMVLYTLLSKKLPQAVDIYFAMKNFEAERANVFLQQAAAAQARIDAQKKPDDQYVQQQGPQRVA